LQLDAVISLLEASWMLHGSLKPQILTLVTALTVLVQVQDTSRRALLLGSSKCGRRPTSVLPQHLMTDPNLPQLVTVLNFVSPQIFVLQANE
jgi:hypothetical protein